MKKFKTHKALCEWIKYESGDSEGILLLGGFDEEFVGLQRNEDRDDVAVYDEKGIIQKIFLKPKSKIHATEILEAWALLKKKKYIF